jgi:hypothetical protein
MLFFLMILTSLASCNSLVAKTLGWYQQIVEDSRDDTAGLQGRPWSELSADAVYHGTYRLMLQVQICRYGLFFVCESTAPTGYHGVLWGTEHWNLASADTTHGGCKRSSLQHLLQSGRFWKADWTFALVCFGFRNASQSVQFIVIGQMLEGTFLGTEKGPLKHRHWDTILLVLVLSSDILIMRSGSGRSKNCHTVLKEIIVNTGSSFRRQIGADFLFYLFVFHVALPADAGLLTYLRRGMRSFSLHVVTFPTGMQSVVCALPF